MKLNPETIARASSRHPGRTMAIWALVLVAGIASAATLLGPALTTDFDFTNSPEAKRAQSILEERSLTEEVRTETFVVASQTDGAVDDPAFTERVNGLLAALNDLGPDVISAAPAAFPLSAESAADPQVAALGPIPSEDGKAVLFTAILAGDMDGATENFPAIDEARLAAAGDGVQAYTLGEVSSSEDFKKISEEDLRFGEGIGVLAAIIVLVIVFGALVAGVTPIVMGIFAIVVTLGIVGLFGTVWSFSFFTPNLISMMGLAVGIDYSLFIVSRYREERHRGREKLAAIAASGATANRAVFFSGMTVVLALAGMLLVPTTIFRSLAGGAIIVVLVSVAASMTLLPAILSLLGDRINSGRIIGRNREVVEPGRPGGFWDRASRAVMRRPVVWLALGALFMLTLSVPYWFQGHPNDDGRGIKTGLAGIGTLPEDAQSKQAFDLILSEFPTAGSQASADVVIVGNGTVGTPGAGSGAPGELSAPYAAAVAALG
nr:MMPL family transporter [Actinomycetota bacterium]